MISESLESLGNAIQQQLQGSVLAAYPTAFAAGILVSLTPCVYPVIPILIGYVGGQAKGSKLRGFLLSLTYVLGMAIIYSIIGAFAALSGKLFGQVQTNPWFQIGVANVIMICGLWMLDVIHIPIPGFLSGGSGNSARAGMAGAFVMGMSSGLVAAPCTAAVLAAILNYVASRQSVVFGTTLLFTFSLGMGVLLIVLGTSVGLLKSLPKPGKWMVWIEKGFGFAMILLAEYFLIKGGILLANSGIVL